MSESSDKYFIRRRGKTLGPFDFRQLERMRRRGQIGRVDEFSTDRKSWRKLSEFEQLFVSAPRAQKADARTADTAPSDSGVDEELILEAVDAPAAIEGEAEWYYCSGGEKYGPFAESALQTMVALGQIQDGDLVWTQGFPDWRPAIEFFTFPAPAASTTAAQPFDPQTAGAHGPGVAMVQAERGAVILVLALLGLLVCGPLCLVAWILGAGDLSEMRRGIRDSRGRGLTTWGMALGIVGTVLWLIGVGAAVYVLNSQRDLLP